MHVSLSQESSKMFSADQYLLTKLQELQKHQMKDIDTIAESKQEEIVSTVRQAIKIAEDDPMVLEYCETRMNQLLVDVTSMVGNKKITHRVLHFHIQIFLKKGLNKRKGY